MKQRLVVLLLAGVLSACGSSSSSTKTDAGTSGAAAQKETPHTLAADIVSDDPAMPRCKVLYETHCQSCHKLHEPSSKSQEKWMRIMPIMSAKAKIDGMTSDSITKYVLAARAQGK